MPRPPRLFLQRWIRDVFALDPRALALFRISVGLVVLYDLGDRARCLEAHYTEKGVLPAARAVEEFGPGVAFSLHYQLSGSLVGIELLFALAGLAALALVAGFRTRLATLLSWYLLASLQVRNHYVAELGGDSFVRLLLFWGIFLPLGARWSVDASRAARAAPRSVLSVASAALVLQIFLMYFATGVLKSGDTWADGRALHYALSLHQYETPLTPLLREQSWLLGPLTHGTLWLERLAPFLLLLPRVQPAARLLAMGLFASLHLGIALFLNIGPFPLMALCAWPAVLPAGAFDRLRLRPRLRVLGPRPANRAASAPEPLAPAASPRTGAQRAAQGFAAAALAYVLVSQLLTLSGEVVPGWLRAFGTLLRINQSWGMFSPDPSPNAMWIGVDGALAGGGHYDPFRDTADVWARPRSIPASYRGFRWRLYTWTALLTSPRLPGFAKRQRDFAVFLCRQWNSSHFAGEALLSLDTIAFISATKDGSSEDQPPIVLHHQDCSRAALAGLRPGARRAPVDPAQPDSLRPPATRREAP